MSGKRAPRGARLAGRVLAFAMLALLVAFAALQGWYLAHVLWWRDHQPASTAFMQARLERLRESSPQAELKHRWVGYDRISAHLKRAVVAAEDARFVGHEGFDWEAIQRAIERNERQGRVVAGASTISQQLAKNLFLTGERSWLRKAQEAAITWMLEAALSKRRILELYLNYAEWGEGVFGAEAAARHHFGVGAAALDARQAAWLAAVLPSPRSYRRGRTTPYLAGRMETIQRGMPVARIP
jgi:monofunctional biosynthetic peptidoglycan transglycosylase